MKAGNRLSIFIAVLLGASLIASSSFAVASNISGVVLYPGLSKTHVTGAVKYEQVPPVGGNHNAVWLNCGIYDKQVPNENAVHSMEHSAVWITYDPKRISGLALLTLRKLIPKTYAILSPYPGISSPIVLSAWGAQLKLKNFTDSRFSAFISEYRISANSPEPGAPCTRGLDATGKVRQ